MSKQRTHLEGRNQGQKTVCGVGNTLARGSRRRVLATHDLSAVDCKRCLQLETGSDK